MYSKEALKEVVREKALEFGDFTLASGKKPASISIAVKSLSTRMALGSSLREFWNSSATNYRMRLVVWPSAPDPITAAILTRPTIREKSLRGFIVRKEAKEHGKGNQVEGPVGAGDRVIIVEDVVTTGGSSLKAIEHVEAAGLKVEKVIAIIDRLSGGREAFAAKGYELHTLLTIEDFDI